MKNESGHRAAGCRGAGTHVRRRCGPAGIACNCLSCWLIACTNNSGQDEGPDDATTAEEREGPETLAEDPPTFSFRNKKSEKCIGVDQASEVPEANIQQFPCDSAANQSWEQLNAGVDKDYWRNKNSMLCMGVDNGSTNSGASIQQFRCDARDNQAWIYDRGTGGLKNVNSGLCIGVDGASEAEGTQLMQFDCDNSANQTWSRRD
jgi:hypothetical protein